MSYGLAGDAKNTAPLKEDFSSAESSPRSEAPGKWTADENELDDPKAKDKAKAKDNLAGGYDNCTPFSPVASALSV